MGSGAAQYTQCNAGRKEAARHANDERSPFALIIRAARTHQTYSSVCSLYCTAYAWFFVSAEGLPALDRDHQWLQRVNVPRCSEDVRVNSTRNAKQNIHVASKFRLRTTKVERLNRVSSLQWTRLTECCIVWPEDDHLELPTSTEKNYIML